MDPQLSELLNSLKARDPAILEQCFRTLNPMLEKVLRAHGYFAEKAEDLIHQTWERFFSNLDKFEGRSSLSTFVCGILINKIREERRAAKRLIFKEDPGEEDSAFDSAGWWNVPPPDPSAKAYSSEVRVYLQECLEGLNENQRAAFILREVEDEASETICNILDVSASNLRVLLFRAKDKLRQCLEGKL